MNYFEKQLASISPVDGTKHFFATINSDSTPVEYKGERSIVCSIVRIKEAEMDKFLSNHTFLGYNGSFPRFEPKLQ